MESNECLIFILVYYLVGYTLMFIFLRDKRIKRDYTTFERDVGACVLFYLWPLYAVAMLLCIIHQYLNKLVDKLT